MKIKKGTENNLNFGNTFEKTLKLLPQRIVSAICAAAANIDKASVNEIRLRLDRPASLTVNGENVWLPIRATAPEIKGVLLALCEGSPYAYSDAIAKGYIPQKNGVRCGVCPTKSSGGSIEGVSSVVIRFPLEITPKFDAEGLCVKNGRVVSTLLYSPPGVGKTTVLKTLIKSLTSKERKLRGAVVDTRCELFTSETASDTLSDFLHGFEKGEGIELAVRSLTPEVIFCDEIGAKEDADALLAASNTGVPIIASAHADSLDALLSRPQIAKLKDNSVFLRYVGITRSGFEYKFDITDF